MGDFLLGIFFGFCLVGIIIISEDNLITEPFVLHKIVKENDKCYYFFNQLNIKIESKYCDDKIGDVFELVKKI